MKRICEIVLYIILALIILSLCACGKTQPVSETIADSAVQTTVALEKTLPEECKTDAIKAQIWAVQTQIKAINAACETEKDVITSDKLKWKVAFWSLIGLIAAYILRKVTK